MESKKGLADPLARLERIIGLLQLVASTRIKVGDVTTPAGQVVRGFEVVLGGITDPASVERSYADIENILKSNKQLYKEYEEHTPEGTFKRFVIEA